MNFTKFLIYLIGLCDFILYTEGASSISGYTGNVDIHENNNAVVNLWTISATCDITYKCTTPCQVACCGTCYTACPVTVACDTCALTNDAGQFQMSGFIVQKQACSSPTCGPTCSASGCLNAGSVYTGTVQCHRASYGATEIINNGAVSESFTMTGTQNAAPTFSFSAGSLINVDHDTHSAGDTINTIVVTDTDAYIDGDGYTITVTSLTSAWITGSTLFHMPTQGTIQIQSSLAAEFSYVFHMVFKVEDNRRQDFTTGTLTISLTACYQTPNCTGSTTTFYDTFGNYTGHGTTNTIFQVTSPNPSDHFPNFRTTWQQLQWTFAWLGDSHSNVDINYFTGEIYATGNISIFPAYDRKTYSLRVTVGNSESCYTTTCDFSFTVIFTNWDLTWVNLPYVTSIKENDDSGQRVVRIILYDYNFYTEDNVTCTMDSIAPNELELFELKNVDSNGEGLHSYNSWEIWRLACQHPGCGYKYGTFGPYLCPRDKGCLNYDDRSQYVITITCRDAYGAVITSTVTVNIVENQAPVYRNLPLTITLDTDQLSQHDTVFSVLYTDNENDHLIYEHVFAPNLGWFLADTGGNYYNNLANISMNSYQWNTTTNATHTDTICAHERRNEICADLTIQLRSNCGTVPTCSGTSVSEDVTFTVGAKLFDVTVTSGHTGCTFSFLSEDADYFNIDTSSGAVTSAKALDADVSGTTYTIVAFVYHSTSCGYGSCSYYVVVSAINYAISIDNLPASVTVVEAITAETTLLSLQTSDSNPEDDISCAVTTISPTPAVSSPPLVRTKETFLGSDVFDLVLRESAGFTSATTAYTVTVSCTDGRGSTDTDTLTINVQVNQPPVFTNLNAAITKDPFVLATGNDVYIVSATDPENDDITYNCYVANTFVPFECSSQQPNYVLMRRTVDIIAENNVAYVITVCIGDARHVNNSCGTLTVTFTSSVTHPVINNLPATQSFAENSPIGTTVYQLAVTDPDAGDVHTYLIVDASPRGTMALFSIAQSTGIVTNNAVFDYEPADGVNSYTLTFTVKDQNVQATTTWDLTVTISNVNEAPTLSSTVTTITFAENTATGTTLTAADFSCTDPDSGETLTYSISGTHSSYFSLSSTDGILKLNTVWDLENGAYPMSTTLTVTCTDSGSLSSTVHLVVEVSAVNEFPPTLTTSFPLGTSPAITSSTALISEFLIITATDMDVFDDGVFSFEILQPDRSGTGTRAYPYFFVQSVNSAKAKLKLSKPVVLAYNVSFPMTIKVSDGEDKELFSFVSLTVYYTASEQTVTGKTTKCLTCTSTGKTLVAALCIEGVLVLIIVAHLIWNFTCRRNNVRRLPRKTRPSVSTVTKRPTRRLGPLSGAAVGGAGATGAAGATGESFFISDTSSSSSEDEGDDESMPNSNSQPRNMSEVGRRGFSMRNSGLPRPMHASQVTTRVSGQQRPGPGANQFNSSALCQPYYV